jgi:hypothetical protein
MEDFWFIVAIRGAKMSQKSGSVKEPAEKVVKDIRRATRKRHSPEEKIRIVLLISQGDTRQSGRVFDGIGPEIAADPSR